MFEFVQKIFEIVGLLLALGDIRSYEWFNRLEDLIDNLPDSEHWKGEKRSWWVTIIVIYSEFFIIGLVGLGILASYEYGFFMVAYIVAPVVFLLIPKFTIHLNSFSGGRALGTFGIYLAALGFLGGFIA